MRPDGDYAAAVAADPSFAADGSDRRHNRPMTNETAATMIT
jgi:hypothetical protein